MQIQADVQTAKPTSSLFQALTSAGWSHGDNDVEIESVVGLAEAQDEEQAEQTRPWQAPVEPGELCVVECKEKQKHSHEHITQKGDNSTAYSFWNRVDCLHKELKEYWYAAVEEYAQQNAGCVQCSCG